MPFTECAASSEHSDRSTDVFSEHTGPSMMKPSTGVSAPPPGSTQVDWTGMSPSEVYVKPKDKMTPEELQDFEMGSYNRLRLHRGSSEALAG